jgi:hypothetical protein
MAVMNTGYLTGDALLTDITRVHGWQHLQKELEVLGDERRAIFFEALKGKFYESAEKYGWQFAHGVFIGRMGDIHVPDQGHRRNEDRPGYGQF